MKVLDKNLLNWRFSNGNEIWLTAIPLSKGQMPCLRYLITKLFEDLDETCKRTS